MRTASRPGEHAAPASTPPARERAPAPASTEPEDVRLDQQRRSRAGRRAATGVLGLVVLLGLLNLLGPRPTTATASAGELRLRVTYASVTRAGLATTWIVEVRRPGGFDGRVEIATTADYFDGFDYNVLYPEPAGATNDGELVVFAFDPPAGDVLRVRLDARATPTWTLWRSATTTVSGRGLPEASVTYRTIFLP